MILTDLLTPERIACKASAPSKKRALEKLSELISSASPQVSSIEVFDSLLARERLGGTGVGYGVAIPHGRLKGENTTLGAFISLDSTIDFDAIDKQPVDLLFALLVPEQSTDEHLQILAKIATMFNDGGMREKLRQATSNTELYDIIAEWQKTN